jgi:hypothetical protein
VLTPGEKSLTIRSWRGQRVVRPADVRKIVSARPARANKYIELFDANGKLIERIASFWIYRPCRRDITATVAGFSDQSLLTQHPNMCDRA